MIFNITIFFFSSYEQWQSYARLHERHFFLFDYPMHCTVDSKYYRKAYFEKNSTYIPHVYFDI